MILLDADVLVIDQARPTDPRRPVNRQFLDALTRQSDPRGIMIQALLEVTGVLSYGTPLGDIPALPNRIIRAYTLHVIPDPAVFKEYAHCRIDELLLQIGKKMSLGDSVQAVQIERFAPDATALITWNAKHFAGKVCIPVLTPVDWLAAHAPPGGTP